MYGIMLVDDEPSVLKGLSELVDWSAMDAGIVASASGGQDALSLMRKVPVQILVTDICMPEMDGLALISEAKALNPALRCIVISAHDEFEYARMALKLGVENYLLKPINANELAETLAKTIDNIQRTDAIPVPSAEGLAFRSNILDRWANSSIQDFELAERAALLHISLNAREYQALVSVPHCHCNIDERLSSSSSGMESFARSLSECGFTADLFIDRYANLSAIVRGENLASRHEAMRSVTMLANAKDGCRHYIAAGHIVTSAYSLDASYKCAYALLPYRYIDPDALLAWYGDFPMAETMTSVDMLRFELALESSDKVAAMDALSSEMSCWQQKSFAQLRQQLMPYQLKMLSFFDDSMHRSLRIPEEMRNQLRGISSCTDTVALLSGLSKTVNTTVKELEHRQNVLHPVVKRAVDIVCTSFDKNISLKTVADKVNMHPSYFGQLFKEETGQLFGDYLTCFRMKKAKNLLACTDRKIGEIAVTVGIAQQSYFNRLFKKQYGITPIECRRAMAEKAY